MRERRRRRLTQRAAWKRRRVSTDGHRRQQQGQRGDQQGAVEGRLEVVRVCASGPVRAADARSPPLSTPVLSPSARCALCKQPYDQSSYTVSTVSPQGNETKQKKGASVCCWCFVSLLFSFYSPSPTHSSTTNRSATGATAALHGASLAASAATAPGSAPAALTSCPNRSRRPPAGRVVANGGARPAAHVPGGDVPAMGGGGDPGAGGLEPAGRARGLPPATPLPPCMYTSVFRAATRSLPPPSAGGASHPSTNGARGLRAARSSVPPRAATHAPLTLHLRSEGAYSTLYVILGQDAM